MVRLISSDGMKDINYDAFALEVEENEDGLWCVNAYVNMVSADEDMFFYTMSVNDTREEALAELSSIRNAVVNFSTIAPSYIQFEDHLHGYGNSDSWHRE